MLAVVCKRLMLAVHFRSLGSLFLLALLSACVQAPLKPPSEGFAAQGRVNIRSQNQANTAAFHWVASPQQDVLSLSSPLGNILAQLTIQYQGGEIVNAQLQHGETIDIADQPEALLAQVTGLVLPVAGMRWWLRGQPDPKQPFTRGSNDFEQSGWMIRASDYRDGKLPYRVELSREDLRVLVLINEWSHATP
ncbi:outer membrane lipoprotein LolB [Deefgea piscis]|uniref:Outer-membrane lipoprotein LolB n=1 Tax=Deefgea piscis TaxID=2739061 RepID=A0A6M8SMP5_9NEIS|nr:lipoprotein insertase outer membrane protein LolB [Deefgea piscis]QKJ66403.1 outer membrane lipoprotein LolB [Deefgea piscis]